LWVGWWTYEYCHASHVRQFHRPVAKLVANANGQAELIEDQPEVEFLLGKFDTDTTSRAAIVEPGPYVALHLTSGTLCDVTGQPRTIDVQVFKLHFGHLFHYHVVLLLQIASVRSNYISERSVNMQLCHGH
jgi:hypothetical protein